MNPSIEAQETDDFSHRIINDSRHPLIRRVVDVMRSTTSKPRTLVIDDEENILQAMATGVEIDAIYASAGSAMEVDSQLSTAECFHKIDENVMKTLFKGDKRARVFALARAPKLASLSDLVTRSGDIVVLDGVRIAGNIGAIIRSACAFEASGVILLGSGLSHVFDRRVLRSSRGLVFSIPVILAETDEVSAFLSAEEIPIVSLAADGDSSLSGIGPTAERVALLMGSERDGASTNLEALSTWRCSVPMNQNVESLNVSVAAGIALYERRRLIL